MEMMTVEIKVNGRIVEIVEVVQLPESEQELPIDALVNPEGPRIYRVNGVFTVQHCRGDGHRALARKALDTIKRMKR
jgi:hypothetical protein